MLDFGVERVSVPSSFLFEVVGDVHFGGFSKLFLASLPQRPRFFSEFLLPRWSMGERDEIACALVQFRQSGSCIGMIDIPRIAVYTFFISALLSISL